VNLIFIQRSAEGDPKRLRVLAEALVQEKPVGAVRLRPTARLPTCTDDITAHSSPAKCCNEDPACAPWAKGLLRRDG